MTQKLPGEIQKIVRFGVFEVNLETGELRKRGTRIRLQDKPFQILRCLLEEPNRLVRREQLRSQLWPEDTFVDFESGLNAAVRKLRAALGDTADAPRFVETLRGRGYRIIAPVTRSGRENDRASDGPAPLSLAVLPFQSAGNVEGVDFLSDGLTEEVIAAVAQIEGLKVVSRSSAFYYKNKPYNLQQVGSELSVAYVLEGGVRQAGSRLRINVELSEVATGYVAWVKSYDRSLGDLFTFQQDLAKAVANSIHAEIQPASSNRLGHGFDDAAAHSLVLQAMHQWNRWTADGWRRALNFYEQAATLQPAYAVAHAGVARSHAALGSFGELKPQTAFDAARAAARRAVELDPKMSDGHGALAECSALYDWDWNSAEQHFKTALRLNPTDAVSRDAYAACCLLPQGKFQDAASHLEEALDVDPISPRIHSYKGLLGYLRNDLDLAARCLERALEIDAGCDFAAQWLGLLRLEQGRAADAKRLLKRLARVTSRDPGALSFLGFVHAREGDISESEGLLEEIEAAGQGRYVSPIHGCFIRVGLERWDEALADVSRMIEIRDPQLPMAMKLPCLEELHGRVVGSLTAPELW